MVTTWLLYSHSIAPAQRSHMNFAMPGNCYMVDYCHPIAPINCLCNIIFITRHCHTNITATPAWRRYIWLAYYYCHSVARATLYAHYYIRAMPYCGCIRMATSRLLLAYYLPFLIGTAILLVHENHHYGYCHIADLLSLP
jgi:hypothetical protein